MTAPRRLRQAGQRLRKKGRRWYGLLGNHAGVVEVPGRSGFYYVRLPQAGGSNYAVAQFRNRGVPAYKHLPVLIEQDPLTGERFITSVDYQMVQYGSGNDDDYEVPGSLEPHNDQHEFGGADQLDWLDTRQLYALRVQPTGNASEVRLQAGTYIAGGEYWFLPTAMTVDLSAYTPANGHTWVMLLLDREGALQVTDVGLVYDEAVGNAYNFGAPPPNTAPLGLVKIESGVATTWADIVDLRFSPRGAPGETQIIGNAEEVLDQECWHTQDVYWGAFDGSGWAAQSFTAGVNGLLGRIVTYKRRTEEVHTYTMELRSGAGVNGPVLGITSYTTSGVNVKLDFNFNPPVEIESGETYTWVVYPPVGESTHAVFNLGNQYSAGRIYLENWPDVPFEAWDEADPEIDLWFRTYVRTSGQYVSIGPWGIYVTGDIALAGLVDGVQVGGLHNEIAAVQRTQQLETYHLRREVQQLRGQVQALARQLDLIMTKHAITEG